MTSVKTITNFLVPQERGISWQTQQLKAAQDKPCTMELEQKRKADDF
jgi:hypothetical protein